MTRLHSLAVRACSLILASVCALTSEAQESSDPQNLTFFETNIRPLLETHCLECHSGQDPQSGLNLEYRQGWEHAGVIQPSDSATSLLVQLVLDSDPSRRMPPPPHEALSAKEIASLQQWIDRGAVDPRQATEQPTTGPKKRNRIFEITEEDRQFWAFQPMRDPEFSPDEEELTPSRKIDRLIARRLGDVQGVRNLATPREQVRRLFLDLWGLPPSLEQVSDFESQPTLERWQQLADTLLDSHHYGERWGRYWLDWVRFAETNGYERDGLKPNAWRYRDYVIDAFHHDKPYDRFVLEQLAGDEWTQVQGWTLESHPKEWRNAIIATGFYRMHVWDDEPDDTEAAEFDDADDIMVTVGSAFLGLTLGCARCHDHKFDPISQNDYYSMLTFLRGIEPYGLTKKGGGGRGTGRIQRWLVPDAEVQVWEANRQRQIAEKQAELDTQTDPAVRLAIDGAIKNLRDMAPPKDSALGVWEIGTEPKPTFVLHRGDPKSPGDQVAPRVPQILQPLANVEGERVPCATSSGARLQLARWMVDPRHPLTARSIVNRIWQRHFGEGIVPTVDDFGRTGLPPSNSELLDFLALELIRSGWSIRHVHRIILATDAYRQTVRSSPDGSAAYAMPQLRRLDAESIRDSILYVSGQLGSKQSGPSVYPTLTQEVRDSANPVSISGWHESPPQDQNCRSVYLIVKRSLRVPFLETLDFTNSTSPTGVRTVTTTAPQALLLLNDPWVQEQAAALSDRVKKEAGSSTRDRLRRLWHLVVQREPIDEEIEEATRYLGDTPEDDIRELRWTRLCRTLLNSSEFLYME
jgi:hypothetical protein